jgi:hypothetical protein
MRPVAFCIPLMETVTEPDHVAERTGMAQAGKRREE